MSRAKARKKDKTDGDDKNKRAKKRQSHCGQERRASPAVALFFILRGPARNLCKRHKAGVIDQHVLTYKPKAAPYEEGEIGINY